MNLLGKHPQTLAFYSDLVGAGLIFTIILVVVISALSKSTSAGEQLSAVMPLSIVFAGLAIALALRMASA